MDARTDERSPFKGDLVQIFDRYFLKLIFSNEKMSLETVGFSGLGRP